MNEFFNNYFQQINDGNRSIDYLELILISDMINKVNKDGGIIYIIGNGGSAAIASHAAIDFTKAANIPATTFNETSLLTCFANDYGYEYWVEKALEFYAKENDMVIFISSSGQSKNIINGARKAKDMGLPLVTLSGFLSTNPLRELGDVNLWIDSSKYNIVEIVHQNWILSIIDFLIFTDS
ncbi:SIS domain-containing protein [Alphaproteobacteria bacterium]|nr:SIS domain-containing protein [Alphaproteobacteria bacterium]MDC1023089.1 SIS domain-containing protein [Alphaproteobacteria bacterium]